MAGAIEYYKELKGAGIGNFAVINLGAAGVKGKESFTEPGKLMFPSSGKRLIESMKASLSRAFPYRLKSPQLLFSLTGLMTDYLVFESMGIPSLSITADTPKLLSIHEKYGDGPDTVAVEGIDELSGILYSFLVDLDRTLQADFFIDKSR